MEQEQQSVVDPLRTSSSAGEGLTPSNQGTVSEPATSPVVSAPVAGGILSVEEIPDRRGWRKSYAYLPEYFVMLVVLSALLCALTNLINIGLDSLIPAEKTSESSYSLYDFSNFELVSSLSTVIVGLPIFILLYLRTKASEAETPGFLSHRWRKGFLGVFLVVQVMTMIGNLSGLVYQIVSRVVDGKDTLSLLTNSTQGDPIWQLMIGSALNIGLIGFAVFVIGKEYRKKEAV